MGLADKIRGSFNARASVSALCMVLSGTPLYSSLQSTTSGQGTIRPETETKIEAILAREFGPEYSKYIGRVVYDPDKSKIRKKMILSPDEVFRNPVVLTRMIKDYFDFSNLSVPEKMRFEMEIAENKRPSELVNYIHSSNAEKEGAINSASLMIVPQGHGFGSHKKSDIFYLKEAPSRGLNMDNPLIICQLNAIFQHAKDLSDGIDLGSGLRVDSSNDGQLMGTTLDFLFKSRGAVEQFKRSRNFGRDSQIYKLSGNLLKTAVDYYNSVSPGLPRKDRQYADRQLAIMKKIPEISAYIK